MKKKRIFCGVLGLLIVGSLAACNAQAAFPLSAVAGNEEHNGVYENEVTNGSSIPD